MSAAARPGKQRACNLHPQVTTKKRHCPPYCIQLSRSSLPWGAIVKSAIISLAVVMALVLAAPAAKKPETPQLRTLTGQVLDSADHPLADAIVYLENTKTLAVKTFITDASGNYRFHALAQNTDYQVYADYKGNRSDKKTLSGFDSRANVTIYLQIKTRK